MDILRRSQSPIAESAWKLIEAEAREVFEANLSARRVVDVDGPHGWGHSAVNLGRLDPSTCDAGEGVFYGIRKVQPLVELRVPFTLDLWELDNVERGARDPDLDALIVAARSIAGFEERAVYQGFAPGNITGIGQVQAHEPIDMPSDRARYADAIARAMLVLKRSGEDGPYALVAGPELYRTIAGDGDGYPLLKQIEALIGGKVVVSPVIDGGFLLSNHKGEFELTLGQDLSIGYQTHDSHKVQLYFTESFTFRILEPQGIVTLQL